MWLALLMIFSLLIGSFLNVVIYRLPLMMARESQPDANKPFNLALPASHCPACKIPLRFWHNIPLVSFLCLRGRCQACQQPISWRYPAVELLSLGLSLLLFLHFGWSLQLLVALMFTYVLLALTVIDIHEQLLPDCLTLPLLFLGLGVNSFDLLTTAHFAIWGAIVGFTLLWLVNELYYLIRKRVGIGGGDCKLLAALGAWLGIQALIPVILMASVLGLVVAGVLILSGKLKYDTPIAFGPFLAIAGWVYLFML